MLCPCCPAAATPARPQFGRWWAQLRAGNSLLLCGFGSKYDLLNAFAREWMADGACFTVNGLHPGLTAKQVGRAGSRSIWHACKRALQAILRTADPAVSARAGACCRPSGLTWQQCNLPAPHPLRPAFCPPLATPCNLQILQFGVCALKGGKPSHYRGCSKDELLQLVGRDARQLYVVLHNIDGPGAFSVARAAECLPCWQPSAAAEWCFAVEAGRHASGMQVKQKQSSRQVWWEHSLSSIGLCPQACGIAQRSSSYLSWRRCPTAT